MNKQALAAIFNWIFVMLAGALIISLFFMLANNQAEAGKERLAQNALQQVNTILSTQATSFDTSTRVPVPEEEIRLTCEAFIQDGQVTLLSQLEIGGFSRVLEDELTVGRTLHTSELVLFSKEWRAPYRLANILHVTSDEELLVLIQHPSLETNQQRLYEAFPDVVTIQNQTGSTQASATGYQTVRAVQIGESSTPPAISSYDVLTQTTAQVHNIYVSFENDLREAGAVHYHHEGSWHGPYHYVGEGMLTALIWQASPPEADCLQHKLVQDLRRQTELQRHRLQALTNYYDEQGISACASLTTRAHLTNLRDKPSIQSPHPLYNFDIQEEVAEVRSQQRRLERGDRCATIY